MKRRRTVGWFLLAAAAIAAFILAGSFPPVTGYYYASAFEHLDGSAGYLHFHDGLVEVVNIMGQGGDSRCHIGTYKMDSRRLMVHLDSPTAEDHVAMLGILGIRWITDIAPYAGDVKYSRRELVPWILRRLSHVKLRPSNKTGAVDGVKALRLQVERDWPAATDPHR